MTASLNLKTRNVVIIGAGLAGSECAWQLAELGYSVCLLEQRPQVLSEAHKTENCAELVCSNSLKSVDEQSAPGQLKWELSQLNSLILSTAFEHKIPAGQALAVDRHTFSKAIHQKVTSHPRISLVSKCIEHFEEALTYGEDGCPIVLATGPLTNPKLTDSLSTIIGKQLYFYDAIAPIVTGESINRDIAFAQNRYDKVSVEGTQDDYLNCPFDKEQYESFIAALASAEKVPSHSFEKLIYFQGCQPVEALLEKGIHTLRFGPMKPKGLVDPRTGKEPYAAIQLRKEDSEGRSWNLVGFQTKLKYPEQKKVFQLIPGLENAEFYRFGSLHRNTYLNSPILLDDNFRLKSHPQLYFAGQITGVEGYLESTAIGALVARMIHMQLRGLEKGLPPPQTTALGALAHSTFNGRAKNYQPMNINWGLVPLKDINERDKEKKLKLVERAKRQFTQWLDFT